MKSIIFASALLMFLSSVARANQNNGYPDQLEQESRSDKDDVTAYESFNSPVYGGGLKSGVAPGKGYPLPPPAPAGYSSAPYFNNNLMPYGYGMMPYSAPYYGYGGYSAPYAAGYGYGAPGYGYPTGMPDGNSLFARSAPLNTYAYGGYPGYAGLGYRFGGLGYNNAGAYRAPPAPVVPAVAPAYAGPAPLPPVPAKGNGFQYGYAPPAPQKVY